MPRGGDLSQRVLVLAPVGRDAELLAGVLGSKGISAHVARGAGEFAALFREGCGAALLTEEALHGERLRSILEAVEEQPAWSEVPFVVLTSRGLADERVRMTTGLMQPLRNATVVERPVRPSTIVTALEGALRDRRRQYEVRDGIEALRRANEGLEAANRELERRVEERTAALVAKVGELEGFSYSVSHDMRTPLRAIVSNAHVVLEEEGDSVSETGREGLQRLSAAAMKMAHLVDDLLQYARLGNSQPRREDCDLSELAERVAEEALAERKAQGARVVVAPGLRGACDPRLVGLVFQNLIDNALKYQPPGRAAWVEVGEGAGGSLFVRDNGIGFEPQYAERIFRAFERLHRDGDYEGTGIGLANVRRIVERHDGRVWAESEPGKGATFFFTLR